MYMHMYIHVPTCTLYCSGMTVCVYIPDCSRMTVWLSPLATCCAGPGSGTSSLTGVPTARERERERERERRQRESEGGRGRGKGREREREEGGGVSTAVAVMYCSSPVFSVALA